MERSQAEDWSFLDAVIEGVYTVPGDGMVDFVSVFRELPDYSGWVVVEAEQDPKKAHPLTYAKMGYANLTRFLQKRGAARLRGRDDAEPSRQAERARRGGRIHAVTPASAGWTYVGFEVYRLDAGQARRPGDGRPRDLPRHAVGQGARLRPAAKDFGVIGGRTSPFEPDPWSLYVPARF